MKKILNTIILVLGFTLAVAVKGGWIGKFWKSVPSWVDNHLPPFLTAGAVFLVTLDPVIALRTFVATYVLKFSMGEEGGAVINNIGNNQYIDNPEDFGRSFGIKKAIQRGVTDGAAFALAFWSPLMILAGLAFVPVYWSMSKLKHKVTGTNDWAWAEPVYGLIFGVFASLVFVWSDTLTLVFTGTIDLWYNSILSFFNKEGVS